MGMFDFAKDLVNGSINRLSGNTDFLEAVCAGAALCAYADGNASDDEVAAALTAVETSPTLLKAFRQNQIETVMNTMLTKAKSGTVGKVQLKRELADIRNKPDIAEVVLCTIIDVASADGSIGDAEARFIKDTATSFGLDANKYLP